MVKGQGQELDSNGRPISLPPPAHVGVESSLGGGAAVEGQVNLVRKMEMELQVRFDANSCRENEPPPAPLSLLPKTPTPAPTQINASLCLSYEIQSTAKTPYHPLKRFETLRAPIRIRRANPSHAVVHPAVHLVVVVEQELGFPRTSVMSAIEACNGVLDRDKCIEFLLQVQL